MNGLGHILKRLLSILAPESPRRGYDAETETRAAIGEAVQLQTSWKEPPFAVTALGPPEPDGDALLSLPVRITAVLPRWRMSDISSLAAMLEIPEDEDHDEVAWSNLEAEPRHTFPADLTLVKGGSHEGRIFFGSEGESIPDQPFTELHYLDDTEGIVELDRRVEAPARVRFDGGSLGTIWDDPPVGGVCERLDGPLWSSEPNPVPTLARVGDTVELSAPTGRGVESWCDLTVLGPPEAFDERTLRVRLRITCRKEDLSPMHLDFQLSHGPDEFGRLAFLLESLAWNAEGGADLPDSFQGVTLGVGETHEAFVYFRVADDAPVPPPESLTVLWYGSRMFELPILLSPR